MINFEKTFAKIYSKQLFKRFRLFDAFRFSVINITFNYENVFFEKSIETNETINFFEIKISEKESILTFDVNKHWNKKYHVKIIQFLKKHVALFKFKFEKFKNDIKMFIFFKNEFDIINLKQTLYFMSTRNKRIMNEMLNSFFEKKTNTENFFKNRFVDIVFRFRDIKERKIKNNHKFKTHQYKIIFRRIFFFETRHHIFFVKKFRNIFIHKFNEKKILAKNRI